MKKPLLLGIAFLAMQTSFAQRKEILLEKNWKFSREEAANFMQPSFDDSKWQNVTVPHDWAIYGPFSMQNDKQHIAITQDGQTKPQEHAGRTGGLPFVGIGMYRTQFNVGNITSKKVSILFDGAMSNAQVYVNGSKVGEWKHGYNSFYFDITPYVKSNTQNTLAVHLENFTESSRWYPGAGLYRNVHLTVTSNNYIPTWGHQITTPSITKQKAIVNIKTKVINATGDLGKPKELVTEIVDATGNIVATQKTVFTNKDTTIVERNIEVPNPKLWSVQSPNLYRAVTKIVVNKLTTVDKTSTTFGIRSIQVKPNDGFYLNGEKIKFQGVCNHHDLGPLGGAVNMAAIRRQIRIMKDMGVNAIRTSHNMPAPELVQACDEMGMMLMAESFDEWKSAKVGNGYNKYYDEWVERDLVNLIHNYRNNPSVVMWSIGNEVPDQWTKEQGTILTKKMQDICHREDATRPVTNGLDAPDATLKNGMAEGLDIAGFNYRPFKYPEAYQKLSRKILLGTETASAVSSRGIYKFPVERKDVTAPGKKYADHQASSYDVEHCNWSNPPEDDFIVQEDLPYAMGEFIWTGFDYLGEPTPYYSDWPSHSSLFGAVDLAGIPKDRFYLYRSHWNKKANTLHILPHWNFADRVGQVTPVFVYTNHPTAELFINGVSQGKRTKDTTIKALTSDSKEDKKNLTRQKRYRLMWLDTKYEPGTLTVVAYDAKGKKAEEKTIHTAQAPHHIELLVDRKTIAADGKDIAFVTVKMVDKNGNLCPNDTSIVNFKVSGAGIYKAAANGNPASLDSFQTPYMHLFSGQLVALVQSQEGKAGEIIFEASSKNVLKASIKISTKNSGKK